MMRSDHIRWPEFNTDRQFYGRPERITGYKLKYTTSLSPLKSTAWIFMPAGTNDLPPLPFPYLLHFCNHVRITAV